MKRHSGCKEIIRVPNAIFGYALAKAGRRNEAEALRKRLETAKEYVSPAELSALYVGLGEREQALSELERAYTEHDLQLQYLAIDPNFDTLRSESTLSRTHPQSRSAAVGLFSIEWQSRAYPSIKSVVERMHILPTTFSKLLRHTGA